ncbi:MAG: hypothetical protein OXE50_02220 [Chloroflexi bacterium]|nr:hypothetical protein [Chloroflexota bacterium]
MAEIDIEKLSEALVAAVKSVAGEDDAAKAAAEATAKAEAEAAEKAKADATKADELNAQIAELQKQVEALTGTGEGEGKSGEGEGEGKQAPAVGPEEGRARALIGVALPADTKVEDALAKVAQLPDGTFVYTGERAAAGVANQPPPAGRTRTDPDPATNGRVPVTAAPQFGDNQTSL